MLLSRSADTLRVAVEGHSDVSEFYAAGGAWVSEDCEAVSIQFEWERERQPRQAPSVADCICSPELADQLMAQLVNPEGDQLEDMLYVLSAGGVRSANSPGATLVN
jgi:hypothetical protein